MGKLAKYSIGVGDRFGHQGQAQVRAVKAMREKGVTVIPVWNKSFREHGIVGSTPDDTRRAADAAVKAEGWDAEYHVDADHIGLKNVDGFLRASDFFTLDVADFIGQPAETAEIDAFVKRHDDLVGDLAVPGFEQPLRLTAETLRGIASRYLTAIRAAGKVYRHIAEHKAGDGFVTEVSMDETTEPQTPLDLLVILAGLSDEGIPAQTIAPKFTGEFHKGVDYIGDPAIFAREFNQDILVLKYAVEHFNLPANLKLSVHSGSDKFSLYPHIAEALQRHDAGVHLKTAGTTWLEEIIGLAASGGEGLAMARRIYREARPRLEELCAPYATVVSIDEARLPTPDTVDGWTADQFVGALQHEQAHPLFNDVFRQFMHVAFRIAAEIGAEYTAALEANAAIIGRHVTGNLLNRHLEPLFGFARGK